MSGPRRRGSRLLGPTLAVGLAAIAVLLSNGVASAHAYLRSSDPADGTTVQTLPATATLDFNETIQNFEPVVVVTGPDGKNYATGAVLVVGNAVSTAVSTDGPTGAYSMAYRVVSADGHPVTGEVKFSVTAPPSSSPGTSTASSSSGSAGAGTSGSTTPGSSTRAPSTPGAPSATGSSSSAAGSSGSRSSQTLSSSSSSGTAAPSAGSSSAAVTAGSSSPVAADPAAVSPVQQPSLSPDWWIWVAIGMAAVILAVAGIITLRKPHED
ncbi:copper resistance CopC family protein [Nakamurella sp. A5-74]|uniref:Copper resistance CopC family protein n=1 Tax=Nakamurella sp. A5-74 TaxID=3158264 RepID=A0AAU8DML3_9ACTN